MPEWAGWTLFVMFLYIIFSRNDYSTAISQLSSKLDELEEKIEELSNSVEELEALSEEHDFDNDEDI